MPRDNEDPHENVHLFIYEGMVRVGTHFFVFLQAETGKCTRKPDLDYPTFCLGHFRWGPNLSDLTQKAGSAVH